MGMKPSRACHQSDSVRDDPKCSGQGFQGVLVCMIDSRRLFGLRGLAISLIISVSTDIGL